MSRWKYTLPETIRHHTAEPIPGFQWAFHNKWLSIYPNGTIYVRRGYSFDGATGVPDFYAAVKGAKFHDPIYQFARDIAEHWECSVRDVIRWGDRVFFEVMNAHAKGYKIIPRIYYAGVRLLGYRYWRIARWLKR